MSQTAITDGCGASYNVKSIPDYSVELRIFVRKNLGSEEECVRFLQDHQVFPSSLICPGKLNEEGKCGGSMKLKVRHRQGKEHVFWKCPKKACRTSRTIRATSSFFSFTAECGRNRSSLTLCDIVEMKNYNARLQ